MTQTRTKKITVLAMLCALAYLTMFFIRLPIISIPGLTLKYEPKDVILVIGGFLYGPLSAMVMAAAVAFIEMVTTSETGPIGFVMNILSSFAFAGTAAAVYKWKRTLSGAAIGLALACVAMTAVMLLWNYIITPIYTGAPRDVVVGLLVPVFLPFNLIKSSLNAAIILLVYKPVSNALRQARLLPQDDATRGKGKINTGVLLAAVFVIVTCVLVILALQGHI